MRSSCINCAASQHLQEWRWKLGAASERVVAIVQAAVNRRRVVCTHVNAASRQKRRPEACSSPDLDQTSASSMSNTRQSGAGRNAPGVHTTERRNLQGRVQHGKGRGRVSCSEAERRQCRHALRVQSKQHVLFAHHVTVRCVQHHSCFSTTAKHHGTLTRRPRKEQTRRKMKFSAPAPRALPNRQPQAPQRQRRTRAQDGRACSCADVAPYDPVLQCERAVQRC